jgi:hypothetical protein
VEFDATGASTFVMNGVDLSDTDVAFLANERLSSLASTRPPPSQKVRLQEMS